MEPSFVEEARDRGKRCLASVHLDQQDVGLNPQAVVWASVKPSGTLSSSWPAAPEMTYDRPPTSLTWKLCS